MLDLLLSHDMTSPTYGLNRSYKIHTTLQYKALEVHTLQTSFILLG